MSDVMRDEILSLTYRPTYRKAQADDGWKRLQEWFKRDLGLRAVHAHEGRVVT